MGRIAGIDYGRARIGVALSDPMKIFASPFDTIKAGKTPEQSAKAVWDALQKQDLEAIVVGLPLHMSGEESPMSLEARKFGTALEALCQLPTLYLDERLSSAQVERSMKEANMSRKKRAKKVDTMAAATILQTHLDSPR